MGENIKNKKKQNKKTVVPKQQRTKPSAENCHALEQGLAPAFHCVGQMGRRRAELVKKSPPATKLTVPAAMKVFAEIQRAGKTVFLLGLYNFFV